jgi:hypothetical protein
MSYEIHQQQLWVKIAQIMNADPGRKWTSDALAEELGIPVGSSGYDRILEVLRQADITQEKDRKKAPLGFV